MKSKSRLLLDKSISAIVSAIEIYNKPDFKYREETFSVLCINAWELLLKAKVLQLSENRADSIFEMTTRQLKNGKPAKKKIPKKNRSGNPTSISLLEAHRIITEDFGVKVDKAVYDNILALTEIRDNAIHFVNADFQLSAKVQELGSASLQNYLYLVNDWFDGKLAKYNFYLMPLSFFRDFSEAISVPMSPKSKNVLDFIRKTEEQYDERNEGENFNLTLRVDIKVQKVRSDSNAQAFYQTNDPNAQKLMLTEESISDRYPWDYEVLKTQLKKKYPDIKINHALHTFRKNLEKNKKFAHTRLLDPNNPKSSKKILYKPEILKAFDDFVSGS
jgi:hypothetical protein